MTRQTIGCRHPDRRSTERPYGLLGRKQGFLDVSAQVGGFRRADREPRRVRRRTRSATRSRRVCDRVGRRALLAAAWKQSEAWAVFSATATMQLHKTWPATPPAGRTGPQAASRRRPDRRALSAAAVRTTPQTKNQGSQKKTCQRSAYSSSGSQPTPARPRAPAITRKPPYRMRTTPPARGRG